MRLDSLQELGTSGARPTWEVVALLKEHIDCRLHKAAAEHNDCIIKPYRVSSLQSRNVSRD
jgi:hypothetical protein